MPTTKTTLTTPQRNLLWRLAQHKYGWTYAGGRRGLMVSDALVRKGLVRYGDTHGREHHEPVIVATEAGRAFIEGLWPVSPYILESYDHGGQGWTPKGGVA